MRNNYSLRWFFIHPVMAVNQSFLLLSPFFTQEKTSLSPNPTSKSFKSSWVSKYDETIVVVVVVGNY